MEQQQAEQTEFIVSLPNGAKHRFYKIPLGELSQPRAVQARQIDYFLEMLIQPNDISHTIKDVLDILENEKSEPDNLKARLRAADKLKPLQDKLAIPDNILRCKISKAFAVWALDGEPVQLFDSNWQSKKLDIIFASNEATAFFFGRSGDFDEYRQYIYKRYPNCFKKPDTGDKSDRENYAERATYVAALYNSYLDEYNLHNMLLFFDAPHYIDTVENGTMLGYYATISARIAANEKLNSSIKTPKT
jgi:hypothetical protein